MVTDLQIAQMLQQLYQGGEGFDHYEPGSGDSGICWALKRTPEADVILLRGSATFQDWVRDLIALATPFSHEAFGPVHPGFEMGMERAWQEIQFQTVKNPSNDVERPAIVAGHSLGAGRAAILTALMIERRCPPIRRVCFGEPKPGFQQLADYIKGVPAASYRNAGGGQHDLITSVPLSFPPEEYVHAAPLTDVFGAPQPDDKWGPFCMHHMELYVKALGG
jgi:hypothetical protein